MVRLVPNGKAGFILMPLLFLLLILAGLTLGIWHLILDETLYQQEFMRYRQFLRLGFDLMEAVESQPRLPRAGTYRLPQVELYPGKETVQPLLIMDYKPKQQVQSLTVSFPHSMGEWKLRRLYLEPPGGCSHPLYKSAALTGFAVGGNSCPALEENLYQTYSEHPFPVLRMDFEEGLKGYLYVRKDKEYQFPAAQKIAGDGVFFNRTHIWVRAGTDFTGRIWLLSRGNIYLEDNVRLANAFIFAQDSIVVGRNVQVCGIIIARNKITRDNSSLFRGNEQVVQTFITPRYVF